VADKVKCFRAEMIRVYFIYFIYCLYLCSYQLCKYSCFYLFM